MKRLATAVALALLGHLVGKPAMAGIVDSPLPVLEAGKPTLHVYSVPGMMDGAVAGVGTFFSCTSTDSVPISVAVESFPYLGGAASNDAPLHDLSESDLSTPGVVFQIGVPSRPCASTC